MANSNGTAQIKACAIARNLEEFDQLIGELEGVFGVGWGGLGFADAQSILSSEHAEGLEIAVIAVDRKDEASISLVETAVKAASDAGLKVILVINDLGPGMLHQLMRGGVDDFLPYPLPEGSLADTIARINRRSEQSVPSTALTTPVIQNTASRNGTIFPVYGLSGGVGATTFATNFAWEIAKLAEEQNQTAIIIDLNFQYGSVATYVDVGRTDGSIELLGNPSILDMASLESSVTKFDHVLDVLPAPQDAVPLDFVGPAEIAQLLSVASQSYDYVIVDLPSTITPWTETVLEKSHLFFALLEMDMRSAHNALRFLRALKADDMPFEKVQFIMNRAPKGTDLSGRSRVKKMADSLDVEFRWYLPDGGKQVSSSCDHGSPLGITAKKNVLRKEIHRIATTMSELSKEAVA
jgi:pilus assembly protein CpaE